MNIQFDNPSISSIYIFLVHIEDIDGLSIRAFFLNLKFQAKKAMFNSNYIGARYVA